MKWMLMPFRRYADFSGRSRRLEFWMFQLLGLIVGVVIFALMAAGGGIEFITSALAGGTAAGAEFGAPAVGPLFWIGVILAVVWALGSLIPSFAVTVRRLHDRNMSGWYFVAFVVAIVVLDMVPVVGQPLSWVLQIAYLVLMVLPGTPGPNKYGADPLGQVDTDVFR